MALTAKMKRFVEEYIVDLNATRAYRAAGYSVNSDNAAGVEGHKLLKNPKIADAIKEKQDERSARTEITADKVLKRWWDIATADPNEIIQFRLLCCRHCFGKDFKYQWKDEEEYMKAVDNVIKSTEEGKHPEIPSDDGGYGYDKLLRPHPKCPECKGEGREDIKISDTRDLSPQAKTLYAGLKTTAAGVEIKLHDQLKALDSVSRHLGLFNDKLDMNANLVVSFEDKLRELFK